MRSGSGSKDQLSLVNKTIIFLLPVPILRSVLLFRSRNKPLRIRGDDITSPWGFSLLYSPDSTLHLSAYAASTTALTRAPIPDPRIT